MAPRRVRRGANAQDDERWQEFLDIQLNDVLTFMETPEYKTFQTCPFGKKTLLSLERFLANLDVELKLTRKGAPRKHSVQEEVLHDKVEEFILKYKIEAEISETHASRFFKDNKKKYLQNVSDPYMDPKMVEMNENMQLLTSSVVPTTQYLSRNRRVYTTAKTIHGFLVYFWIKEVKCRKGEATKKNLKEQVLDEWIYCTPEKILKCVLGNPGDGNDPSPPNNRVAGLSMKKRAMYQLKSAVELLKFCRKFGMEHPELLPKPIIGKDAQEKNANNIEFAWLDLEEELTNGGLQDIWVADQLSDCERSIGASLSIAGAAHDVLKDGFIAGQGMDNGLPSFFLYYEENEITEVEQGRFGGYLVNFLMELGYKPPILVVFELEQEKQARMNVVLRQDEQPIMQLMAMFGKKGLIMPPPLEIHFGLNLSGEGNVSFVLSPAAICCLVAGVEGEEVLPFKVVIHHMDISTSQQNELSAGKANVLFKSCQFGDREQGMGLFASPPRHVTNYVFRDECPQLRSLWYGVTTGHWNIKVENCKISEEDKRMLRQKAQDWISKDKAVLGCIYVDDEVLVERS